MVREHSLSRKGQHAGRVCEVFSQTEAKGLVTPLSLDYDKTTAILATCYAQAVLVPLISYFLGSEYTGARGELFRMFSRNPGPLSV